MTEKLQPYQRDWLRDVKVFVDEYGVKHSEPSLMQVMYDRLYQRGQQQRQEYFEAMYRMIIEDAFR